MVLEIVFFPAFMWAYVVQGKTALPLSEVHKSRTTVSREPGNIYKWDLYQYVGENLHIPMISMS